MSERDQAATVACCEVCGTLPEGERLDTLNLLDGPITVHSILVREARGWEAYFGPEPAEYEPCGPVTMQAGRSSLAGDDRG